MTQEIYRKHRPKTLDEVVGQPEAVSTLTELLEKDQFPHALLLVGNSGTGKNTIARIIRKHLDCRKSDYKEIDCATDDGLKEVREIKNKASLSPLFGGKSRVYCLNEFQSLSRAQFCQQSLLMLLEDPPDHCYFILAAMDAAKIIDGIKTRCLRIDLKPIPAKEMVDLVADVWRKERPKDTKSADVVKAIVEASSGSARTALVLLQKVINLKTEEEQLAAIRSGDVKRKAFDLAKELIWGKRKWSDVQAILADMKDEDPEGVRRLVLACADKEMDKPKGNHKRAFRIYCCFEGNWFDSGISGLRRACWECSQEDA